MAGTIDYGEGFVVLPLEKYNELINKTPSPAVSVKQDTPKAVKKAEEKPKKRVVVDRGKIKALHDAGWSAFEIAEDMNLSLSTVYDNLPPLKKG